MSEWIVAHALSTSIRRPKKVAPAEADSPPNEGEQMRIMSVTALLLSATAGFALALMQDVSPVRSKEVRTNRIIIEAPDGAALMTLGAIEGSEAIGLAVMGANGEPVLVLGVDRVGLNAMYLGVEGGSEMAIRSIQNGGILQRFSTQDGKSYINIGLTSGGRPALNVTEAGAQVFDYRE